MKEYIFTFGSKHLGIDSNGESFSLGEHYFSMLANDVLEARDNMFNMRGDQWAFVYMNEEEAGVQRFNLKSATKSEVDVNA